MAAFAILKIDIWQQQRIILIGVNMNDIGNYIKEKREAAGISLKALGKYVGVSDSEIHKIESGQRKSPNWITLCEIGKALNISPLEILIEAGMISKDDIAPQILLKGIDKLTEEQLADVQDYINFLQYKGIYK